MKLFHLSLTFIISALLALGMNVWMLLGIQQQQSFVETSMYNRKQSIDLIARIEHDTYQLSQFVRAYISTEKIEYSFYYYDLLDIRKGIKPEPEGYNSQYWYEVMAGNKVHNFERSSGVKAKPLVQQLVSLSFSDKEIQYLERVIEISEKLSDIEKIAFAAIQGLYDPTRHSFIDSGTPQTAFALSLINSPEYLQLNNQLLHQIKILMDETDQRTKIQVIAAQMKVHQATLYAIITVIVSISLILFMGFVIFKRILSPLKKLFNATNKLQYNQYDTRVDIGKSVFEIVQLARNFNEMAANIETDIIHRTSIEQELTDEKRKTEDVHNKIRDSIFAASLIQQALIPRSESLAAFFKEQMYIWKPKDVVGGDIYLFTTLRNETESLLLVIDCTGHGVPGAFLTMLIKAIYQQLVTNLKHRLGDVSTAKLLAEFNVMLKHLLRQEDIVSGQRIPRNMPHDVGFDGAIVYCDQERNLVRFSGAHTPLFYMNDSDLTVIKGDRQSIGYRSSKTSFEYTEHDIISTPFTTFYLTTDGYLDQSGGEKGFPFGKKRFEQMLKAQTHQTLAAQKKTFLQALQTHQKQEAQTDDITVFAFRL